MNTQYKVSYDNRTGDFVVIEIEKVQEFPNNGVIGGVGMYRIIATGDTFNTTNNSVYDTKAEAQLTADINNKVQYGH